MSGNLSDLGFGGQSRIISLPAGFSVWGGSRVVAGPNISTATGAITAGGYVTILNVTGAGVLRLLAATTNNSMPKTVSIRITRDGTVLPVVTSASVSTAAFTASLLGSVVSGTTSSVLADGELEFDRSLLIEVTTSVSESGGLNVSYLHELRA